MCARLRLSDPQGVQLSVVVTLHDPVMEVGLVR